MFVRQPKLTLNSPYHKISTALWQNKRFNCQKQKENLQLKTKISKMAEPKLVTSTEECFQVQLERRYRKLAEEYREKNLWIRDVSREIQERKYEELCVEVKKIENTLQKVTDKAIKMEKRMKKGYLRSKEKEARRVQTSERSQQDSPDPLLQLENDKKKLQNLLDVKLQQVQQLQLSNKDLNKEILTLLTIKNALREETKKVDLKSSKWTQTKASFLRTDNTKTS